MRRIENLGNNKRRTVGREHNPYYTNNQLSSHLFTSPDERKKMHMGDIPHFLEK